jgi:hypothetical protein|tara:strand:- start:67 stop:711 length:645 start_codon:yes stop_codon:yes gene_type:complete
MIVSHKHRLIFTHIPKNAGTSIRQWFLDNVPDAESEQGILKHQTPHHVHTRHHNNYDYFAVVRNPYDRLLSQYHFHLEKYEQYLGRKSQLRFKQSFQDKYAELQKGFSHWLEMDYPMADRTAKWYDYRWCPQSVWTNERTHVLNHETLETDFRWVQERVGVDAPLETLNSTTANNDHSTMKNRLLLAKHRPLILSHLLVDFKRFGYAPNFDRSK